MMPLSSIFCLICDGNIDNTSGINIFSTTFPRHGEILANFMSKVLRVSTFEFEDPYICLQCYNLFKMLEQAQKTVLSIRCEITKIYHATERRKNIKESVNNDMKLNLADMVLEEEKLLSGSTNVKGKPNLESFHVEGLVEQQCVQNNTNVPNIDHAIVKTKIDTCNDTNNSKSFNYNDTHNNVDENTSVKKDAIHTSVPLSNNSNECNINISRANMHIGEEKYITLIGDRNDESLNCIKRDATYDNRFQVENLNYKWRESIQDIAKLKETSESIKKVNIDEIKVPGRPSKLSRQDLKSLKYSCPTCNKRWKTAAELKIHANTHSSLRPFMCEKCGQAYKHKHALEIHIGMHNGINPFQCQFCQKCFTQKGALMRHLPIHTGEMPYQCELCGKRFIHHTSYKMHRLSHSGKKSYKCHMCDLSLLSTSHLKRHMRVHTGEKPYSCTVCGKRFAERYNLLAHQKVHDPLETKAKKTKNSQYQCNYCNLLFEQKQNFNEHIKQHIGSNNYSNLEKLKCRISEIATEGSDLAQSINSEHGVLQQTWIEISRPKLDIIDSQTKFVFLQNALHDINENVFAVTFSDQNASLESTNYNTNLQVIIEPSNTILLSNKPPSTSKMHI